MSDNDDFFAMRQRAYDLAETGVYKHWTNIADVLLTEGFSKPCIARLGGDGLAVMMITRCCEQARV